MARPPRGCRRRCDGFMRRLVCRLHRSIWPVASGMGEHHRKPRVLKYGTKCGRWPTPPKPGDADTTPGYFVDTVSTARYRRITESDREYFDVYTLFDGVIYEDEFPVFKVPLDGTPIIVHAGDGS